MHLPDVYQGYTCEEKGQTAKERNTKLEVASTPHLTTGSIGD